MCSPEAGHKDGKDGTASAHVSIPASMAMGIVHLYRLTFSALVGRQCRYLPTCSEYALDALRRFGLWRGMFLTLARLCRCGPFGAHGFDPVPLRLRADARWWCPWRFGVWRLPQQDDNVHLSDSSN